MSILRIVDKSTKVSGRRGFFSLYSLESSSPKCCWSSPLCGSAVSSFTAMPVFVPYTHQLWDKKAHALCGPREEKLMFCETPRAHSLNLKDFPSVRQSHSLFHVTISLWNEQRDVVASNHEQKQNSASFVKKKADSQPSAWQSASSSSSSSPQTSHLPFKSMHLWTICLWSNKAPLGEAIQSANKGSLKRNKLPMKIRNDKPKSIWPWVVWWGIGAWQSWLWRRCVSCWEACPAGRLGSSLSNMMSHLKPRYSTCVVPPPHNTELTVFALYVRAVVSNVFVLKREVQILFFSFYVEFFFFF